MAQIDGARQLMTSALATARTLDRLTDSASESFPKSQPVASATNPVASSAASPAASPAASRVRSEFLANSEPVASAANPPDRSVEILRIPHITIHIFCDTPSLIGAMERAVADRRMARTSAKLLRGGIAAAIDLYSKETSPNLIIIENHAPIPELYAQLDALANLCVAGTKVVIIGIANDVAIYRELIFRGVSDYAVAPLDPLAIIELISRAYRDTEASRFGRVLAFVGASGGVGSSTIAQNVASTIARSYASSVIFADLDLPFGTAGLGFDLNASEHISDALNDGSRLDDILLERLLTKHHEHLQVLTAPANLDQSHDLTEDAFERVLDIAQANASFVVVDVPHVWTPWVRKVLLAADEVVISASPTLASFRNVKNLVDVLKKARLNDEPPRLVLNQIGIPKRTEIKPDHFADSLKIKPIACIPFDVSVATAANNGQMMADAAPKSAVSQSVMHIADVITGRKAANRAKRFDLKNFDLLNRFWPRH
jgi:pilus assembly protein CpaE